MANYYYTSTDGSNYHFKGELTDIPADYLHYEDKSFGESVLYYLTNSGKVTDIIAESVGTEAYARKEISETFAWVKSIL